MGRSLCALFCWAFEKLSARLIMAGIGPGAPGPSVTHFLLPFFGGCFISSNICQKRTTMQQNPVQSLKLWLPTRQCTHLQTTNSCLSNIDIISDLVLLPLNSEHLSCTSCNHKFPEAIVLSLRFQIQTDFRLRTSTGLAILDFMGRALKPCHQGVPTRPPVAGYNDMTLSFWSTGFFAAHDVSSDKSLISNNISHFNRILVTKKSNKTSAKIIWTCQLKMGHDPDRCHPNTIKYP